MAQLSSTWVRFRALRASASRWWNDLLADAAERTVVRYLATFAIIGLAALAAAVVPPAVYSVLLVMGVAVSVVAWYFGRGPAFVALILGVVVIHLLVPEDAGVGATASELYLMGGYASVTLILVWLMVSRRRVEQSLRRTEKRFALFTQRLPGLAWIKDSDGRYVYANDTAAEAFGRRPEKLYGLTDEELFSKETAARFRENDLAALASKHGIFVEEALVHSDGTVHRSLVSKFPIPAGEGGDVMVAGMAIDVTERRQAEEALREADRRKDIFIATLSHELRNPLAPLSNGLQLLQMQPGVPENVANIHEMMDRQIRQLARLIDDLLDVSRITTGRLQLKKRRADLRSIISDAVDASSPHIESQSQQLRVIIPREPVFVDADPARIAQALLNLLNNASKFTDRGGNISLRAETEGGWLLLRVTDTGIGVPEDLRQNIFEMFYQGDSAVERSQSGMGVGLSLVRAIVELHGGTIECQSGGPGTGATFLLRLPISEHGAADVEIRESPSLYRDDAARFRLLVVDDNRDAVESFSLLLQDMGNTVVTAHDGTSALEAAREFRPHAVMLDIGLPGMSGYEVATRMRQMPELQDTVLIAVTGWGEAEDRRRTREVGFAHHVVKPVSREMLLELMSSLGPAGAASSVRAP